MERIAEFLREHVKKQKKSAPSPWRERENKEKKIFIDFNKL